MQILYWHLTRPQTSTCGGSLSPPLLERQDGTGTSAGLIFPKASLFEQAVGPSFHQYNQSSPKHLLPKANTSNRTMEMENEDQTPTFYLLNAVDLPEDEDTALNHHLELIHGQSDHDSLYSGPLVAVGNGPSGDGGDGNGPPGGHYGDQRFISNKRKKRRSNDLARVLSIEDESDDDSAVNIGPSKSKKAKLVVNLYPEDQGYSFGYQLPGSIECSESHAIPYSERYLLDSIDAQQIPNKMLCRLEDRQGVNLMRYRNQVIAEIRDYRKSFSVSQNLGDSQSRSVSLNSNGNTNASSNAFVMNGGGGNSCESIGQSQKPTVRQVMLSPTTESLLCDFDMIVEKAVQDRGGWNALVRQTPGGDLSHLLDDGSDSDYEYEVDLEASQRKESDYLTYDQRLELEKIFVNQTAGPLCLDPSPQVSIITNRVQFENFKWNTEEMKQATKRWEENPFKSNRILMSSSDSNMNAPSHAEGRLDIEPLYAFITNMRAKSHLGSRPESDKDALRLPPISYQDYPNVDPPKNMDDVLRIGQIPEPAQLRLFPNENTVRKIEEYILETERRKRPHTTTLSIFQRNNMESYFGELEMESFLDPNQPRIGSSPSSTKCQFELGSSRNVTLYVKQFSDIFTEDGRRPCKITYQKVGQPPQVVYTNSYKSATTPTTTAANSTTTPSSQTQTTVTAVTATVPQVVASLAAAPAGQSTSGVNVVVPAVTTTIVVPSSPQIAQAVVATVPNTSSAVNTVISQSTSGIAMPGIITVTQQPQTLQSPPTPASSSPSPVQGQLSTATTTVQSLPPVQIVHPQPRTNPQQQQQQQQQQKPQTAGQRPTAIQIFSQQNQATNNVISQTGSAAANVNLNVNLSSSGITPQQVLTRPHIVNVNLQQQQQQAAAQQLLQATQQRLLRMKQQQPNTALAKLLLTNLQSKPITVAVQPTPQNPATATNSGVTSPSCNATSSSNNSANNTNTTNSNSAITSPTDQQAQQNPLGSPLMIASPPSVSSTITNPSPNVNVNVNASPNVSVNLNTISLDGLLPLSTSSVNYGTASNTTQATASNLVAASNLGLNRISNSPSPTMNILRINNNPGTTAAGGNAVQLATVQRQLAISNALNGNVSILQQNPQQPQQRILINANSMSNLNLNTMGQSEIEELSVPDLTTLLGGQPIQISQLGQQQHILTNAAGSASQPTTIDTTNLNLNLNVNLNSGTVVNTGGEGQVQQHQIAKIQGGEWTTTAQAPPFLVFISPLRPMSIATQAASAARQVTGTVNSSSTLSLNLGAVQTSQQQHQLVQNQPSKTPEPPTRILLGACNNGVAIKREPPATSTSSMITLGTDSLSQSQLDGVDEHLLEGQQVVSSSDVVVDGVDSLFNALSEAIGPEQLQKLDAIGGTLTATSTASTASFSVAASQTSTSVVEAVPAGIKVVASTNNSNVGLTTSTSSATGVAISNNKTNSTNVITLSDLLSPTVVSSSTGSNSSFSSLILSNISSSGPVNSNSSTISTSALNSSPTLSSLLNSVTASNITGGLGSISSAPTPTSTATQSSIVTSTPRLSALLAGTPSADTVVVGANNGPTSLLSPPGAVDSSTGTSTASYGTLLDRLAASLNQPQGNSAHLRTGASRLNPIATATPSVVLDHPVLAATLTQQQQPNAVAPTAVVSNRGSTYRQIAPAPSPVSNINPTSTTSIGNSNVAVISSSDVQSHIQSPQLINLLGLVGSSTPSTGTGQARTIRISASSPANNPSPGSASR